MKNKRSKSYEKTLPNKSKFGRFEAELTSRSSQRYMEYCLVNVDCCNYEFYMKLCEAIQPILDELTEEMDELLLGDEDK